VKLFKFIRERFTKNRNIKMERLQKIIARSGICSRRKAEELIAAGKVTVNGDIITEMGYKANVEDIIFVDGKQVIIEENIYLLMNKPRYTVCTTNDELSRRTVISILPESYKKYRLFPVGRLDYDTKGVLLITNDGEFMNELVGPKSNIEKEYLARLDGIITKDQLKKLENGVKIDDYVTRRCRTYLSSVDRVNNSSSAGIILKEGKNHQVKKMFDSLGYEVKRLTRLRFGELTTEGLAEGDFRELKPHEIKRLLVISRSN
jgi:23S rRNA pseudouridine2605 synthase